MVVRGGVEPPTFRFSGRTYPKVAWIAWGWCAVAGRGRQPLVAAVAVSDETEEDCTSEVPGTAAAALCSTRPARRKFTSLR